MDDLTAFVRARLGDQRLPERFWEKVRVNGLTGCWLWMATRSRHAAARAANPERSRAQARIRDARYRARKKGQTA